MRQRTSAHSGGSLSGPSLAPGLWQVGPPEVVCNEPSGSEAQFRELLLLVSERGESEHFRFQPAAEWPACGLIWSFGQYVFRAVRFCLPTVGNEPRPALEYRSPYV